MRTHHLQGVEKDHVRTSVFLKLSISEQRAWNAAALAWEHEDVRLPPAPRQPLYVLLKSYASWTQAMPALGRGMRLCLGAACVCAAMKSINALESTTRSMLGYEGCGFNML